MSLKVFWSLKPSLSDQPGFYDLDLLDDDGDHDLDHHDDHYDGGKEHL